MKEIKHICDYCRIDVKSEGDLFEIAEYLKVCKKCKQNEVEIQKNIYKSEFQLMDGLTELPGMSVFREFNDNCRQAIIKMCGTPGFVEFEVDGKRFAGAIIPIEESLSSVNLRAVNECYRILVDVPKVRKEIISIKEKVKDETCCQICKTTEKVMDFEIESDDESFSGTLCKACISQKFPGGVKEFVKALIENWK